MKIHDKIEVGFKNQFLFFSSGGFMKNIVVVGSQWGDEGKGKITDFLAQDADIVVRYQGGNNAGHTVYVDGVKYAFHLLPSGILNPKCMNVLANGMVIHPGALMTELKQLNRPYQLFISDRSHVIFPHHIEMDIENEIQDKIGTTKKGIGPAYSDKSRRKGVRMIDFIGRDRLSIIREKMELLKVSQEEKEILIKDYLAYSDFLKPMVTDTSRLLNEHIHTKKVLFEGAQGVMLCLDHGTYPFVTSSSPTAASVPLNTGLAPWLIKGAIGVTKAYTTRVGEGPFPSEIHGPLAHEIRERGHEYGTTTKRPRRIGWLDLVVINYAKRVSGLSYLAVTLLDVLSGVESINVVTHYELDGKRIDDIPADFNDFKRVEPVYLTLKGWNEDITKVTSFDELPDACKAYLNTIEKLTATEVAIFSVGPERNQTILRKSVL